MFKAIMFMLVALMIGLATRASYGAHYAPTSFGELICDCIAGLVFSWGFLSLIIELGHRKMLKERREVLSER